MNSRYSKAADAEEVRRARASAIPTKDEIAVAKAFIARMQTQGRITFGPKVDPAAVEVEETKVTPDDIAGWTVGQSYEIQSNDPRKTQIRISTAARRKGVKLRTTVSGQSVVCLRVE